VANPDDKTSAQSRVIPGDGETAFQRWELPNLLTADKLERIQKQAYDEGFARGRSDGLREANAEMQARAGVLEKLLKSFAEPLEELDDRVEQELVALALAAARVIVRRELKADPAQVVAAVREALSALPAAARNVRVQLHPEDAALVRQVLNLSQEERAWQIVEDPLLMRGGCKVVTDTSQVDASLDARLTAIMTAVLGGERAHD
jgi:flagellar assembly protein FliH